MSVSTNEAWKLLFAKHDLAEELKKNGHAELTADEIKDGSTREPRLMTKFDFRESRPRILQQHGVTILPIENGKYVLAQGDGYVDLPTTFPGPVVVPSESITEFETLTFPPTSESAAIDMAHACGILGEFTNEGRLVQTVRGRLRSGPFSYDFKARPDVLSLHVDGVQVEVDGGYEGARGFYVIEAKLGTTTNFIARQLYYPLRMWRASGRLSKPIVPIFLGFSNNELVLVQYEFDPVNEYHSIRIRKKAKYTFDRTPVHLTFSRLVAGTLPGEEPEDVPFPQADDLRKVRDTIDAVAAGVTSRDELAEHWNFDARQGDYYANAAAYLGFVERDGHEWALTEAGKRWVREVSASRRNKMVAQALLSRPTFHAAAAACVDAHRILDAGALAPIVARHTGLEGTTPKRRASTVAAWLRGMLQLFPDHSFRNDAGS